MDQKVAPSALAEARRFPFRTTAATPQQDLP
jgi:hypothetical protein